MAIKFSTKQLKAIDSHGKNIIVSAGAGSGKTAVLTERIKRILLSGVKANELLVLTFTNAAAAEMKERITKTMSKDAVLKNRTHEVDNAYITTFDSFSLSLVKKYHDKLNLTNNLSIIESSVLNVYKRKVLDELFLKRYQSNDKAFESLIFDLTSKNDNSLKSEIIKIANKLDLKTNRDEYLNTFIEHSYNETSFERHKDELTSILLEKINYIRFVLLQLEIELDEKNYDKHKKVYQQLLDSKTYDEIRANKALRAPSVTNASEKVKQLKDEIKKSLEDINKLTPYTHVQEMKEAYFQSKQYAEVVFDILKEYFDIIDSFKYKHESFEFADISKLAIKLVKDYKEVKDELTNKFKEILIDEYQDTNDIQEEFISYISKNNVYMVGDIKQSIYGFRNANPMIFKNKYDLYKDDKNGIKIDLNQNFRSNRPVLNTINKVFNHIMDDSIGNANFIKEHQMRFGLTDYDKNPYLNKIKFISYEIPEDFPYKNKDVDMFYVVNNIKEKINNKELVYDKDSGSFRPCEYKDFAILIADSKLFEPLSLLLSYNHIPCNVYKNVEVNKGVIVTLIKNIIKLIVLDYKKEYNEDFMHCFYSVSRSFIVQQSEENLFEIITLKKYKNTSLYQLINKYSANVLTISLSDLLQKIIDDFNIYEKLIEIGEIQENITRIEFIFKIIDSMNQLNLTVFDFVEYFDDILENDDKMEFSSSSKTDNKVKIMTIHKSKGLEFPIVYFINNDKLFNKSESKDKFVFDENYGLISPYFISGEGKIVTNLLMKERNNISMISEKIRLLYVALTRAREQIVILNPTKKDNVSITEFDGLVSNIKRQKYNSFSSIYNSVAALFDDCNEKINPLSLNINDNYLKSKTTPFEELINNKEYTIENKAIFIDNNDIKKEKASKVSGHLFTKDELSAMEYGTYIHEIFETFNFKEIDYSLYDDKTKAFLENFMSCDLLTNINKAKIYKEFEFIYKVESKEIHGIIDLMLEYDDHIDIIDYKLSNIQDEAYIKQLNTYKKYIESKSYKKVCIYLYSIMQSKFEKVVEI